MTGSGASTRDVFGLLLLDKPAELSSNRALQRVKRLYAAAKAGHAGSLDPLATGMLPIFFGAATRLAALMLEARKTYRVTAKLGCATTTGDAEGEVIEDRSHERPPTAAQIDSAARGLLGEIEQVPPMYSALKHGGVPLYRLARRGVTLEREPRRVFIERLEIRRFDWPELDFDVRCSKGTYVRTLVEDLAKAAGTLGHVTALRRLAVDPFEESGMRSLEAVEQAAAEGFERLDSLLLPADAALPDWPSVRLSEADTARLMHGQTVAVEGVSPGDMKVYAASGRFIALGQVSPDGRLAPTRVFIR